jgi:hypothetical protein
VRHCATNLPPGRNMACHRVRCIVDTRLTVFEHQMAAMLLILVAIVVPIAHAVWDRQFVELHIPDFSCVGCTLSTGI